MSIVLVVEDEGAVLSIIARTLSEGGYGTVQARHGQEAWEYLQRPGHHIDLLLADVVMPQMTGTELAARAVAIHPGLPIVLMSGYTSEDLAQRGLQLSHGHLLTKPFDPPELLRLVNQLLPIRPRSAASS